MKLNSGKSFSLPFDELVLFATNLSPADLMDTAFLRRIPYKIEVFSPAPKVFSDIFHKVAGEMGVESPQTLIDEVSKEISSWGDVSLAGYQPKFIIEQIQAACRFAKVPFEYKPQFVRMALSNLRVSKAPDEESVKLAKEAHGGTVAVVTK